MRFKGKQAHEIKHASDLSFSQEKIQFPEKGGLPLPKEQFSFVVSMRDHLPIKVRGTKWRSDFNKLKWSRLELVAKNLKALIEECLPDSNVSLEGELEAQNDQLVTGFALDIINADSGQVKQIAQGFLMGITGSPANQDDLFYCMTDEFKPAVARRTDEFLDGHGNQNIRTPMQVQGDDLNFFVVGKFAERPRQLPQKHDILRCQGSVNGFKKSSRTCYLLSTDAIELQVQFDLQFFLKEIGAAALSGEIFEFTLLPRENEKGRILYELTDIKDCPQPPDHSEA